MTRPRHDETCRSALGRTRRLAHRPRYDTLGANFMAFIQRAVDGFEREVGMLASVVHSIDIHQARAACGSVSGSAIPGFACRA